MISIGLSTSRGPDWIKDVLVKAGVNLKVHNDLRKWMRLDICILSKHSHINIGCSLAHYLYCG